MPLSDYDDPVEKIAALKAATLDPALTYIHTSNYDNILNLNEVVYIFDAFGDVYIIRDGIWYFTYDRDINVERIQLRLEADESCEHLDTLFYVKDSDITYSVPIMTYQDRLSSLYTTDVIFKKINESFVAGDNGSIITACNETTIGGGFKLYSTYGNTSILPVRSGITISVDNSSNAFCRYFDVPADW